MIGNSSEICDIRELGDDFGETFILWLNLRDVSVP